MTVSILILTKNEEQDLPGCLDSVAWSDDIHVYDSMSTDRTLSIARLRGGHITQRVFDNWAAHQNWGLANIRFKHPWVFYIDADERMTPELVAAVKQVAEAPGGNVAFRIHRRDFFLGTWLKHAQSTPFYMRLFRPECMRYERLVNPVSIPSGPVGDIGGYLDHFPFSKGIDFWFDRHNRYSRLEAEQILMNRSNNHRSDSMRALLTRDKSERRLHQKELFYRLPFRPLLKFILLYFIKGGFLDGRAGWLYCQMQACYERMIVTKTAILAQEARAQRRDQGETRASAADRAHS